jgi:hypothetical protein
VRKGGTWLKTTLVQCAWAAVKKKDNRIPVLELPFQQAGSAQLSGTSRSNDQPPAPYGTDQHQHERSDYDPDQRRLIQLHGGWASSLLRKANIGVALLGATKGRKH